ncbi:MAG: insulinase family protein [Bacteroidetes bacterium]|nr:insulinase family protein [Bacteroidota bacterium]
MVSLQGAWSLPTSYAEHAGLVLNLLAGLLDKGTVHQDKRAISDALDRVGASISFSAGVSKIQVSARCLSEDLPLILALIREQVEEPSLPARELDLMKGRMRAILRRQRSDPGAVCRNEMSRLLFAEDHPSRDLGFDQADAVLEALDREALWAQYRREGGWEGLRLAVVGDVDALDPSMVAEALVVREGGEGSFRFQGNRLLHTSAADIRHVQIPDRANLNVQLGHAVEVGAVDPDFLPLWVAVFVLGGNFSSRLMTSVRDERGLTYGIHSSLGQAGRFYGGAWNTSVTLSQDRLEEGIQATREVVDHFLSKGVTASELTERVETLAGSYQVELATTSGVAARLLHNMNRGREPGYMDDYPDVLRSLDVAQVNDAVHRWLDASRLSLVTAGTRSMG